MDTAGSESLTVSPKFEFVIERAHFVLTLRDTAKVLRSNSDMLDLCELGVSAVQ